MLWLNLISYFVLTSYISFGESSAEFESLTNSIRIVNGTAATPHEFPWIVSLQARPSIGHYCGGSIISREWILTAAHCVNEGYIRTIYAGTHDYKVPEGGTRQVRIPIRIYAHPEYKSNRRGTYNDVALIQLSEPLEYNEYVQPIQVPPPDFQAEINSTSIAIGWGAMRQWGPSSNILMKVNLTVFPKDECDALYAEGNYIVGDDICVGDRENWKGACHGDSGSSLHCNLEEIPKYICGITSWVYGGTCANPKGPAVYMKVSNYFEWIMRTIVENEL